MPQYSDRAIGPYDRNPVTHVRLNPIKINRKSLDFMDAVTAHVLYLQGKTVSKIAQYLGTTVSRVSAVLREKVHPDAKSKAIELLRQ